jgi:tetratricopeptide (TPR) repeat protein
VTAGNLLAAHLRQSPSGQQQDLRVADLMDRYYERAARLDPADVYTRLSPALAAAAKPDDQVEAVQLLHALRDDTEVTALAEFWQALAEVRLGGPRRFCPEFHAQREPRAAERAARQVTTLKPEDAYGWYLLGLALQEQGRYMEAIRANTQGRAAQQRQERRRAWDPDQFDGGPDLIAAPLLTNLATCHAMLGVFELAWPLYQQAHDESGSPIVRLERAEAYHLAGMTAEAQAELQPFRKQTMGERVPYPAAAVPTAWTLLTFPDAELRDPVAARGLLAGLRKRELWQDDPVALTLLSYASVLCGEPEAASELLHRIPATAEPHPFQDAVWAAVLHASGERDQARQRLEQAERIAQSRAHPDRRLTRLIGQVRQSFAAE